MSADIILASVPLGLAMAAAGTAFGLVYFAALRWTSVLLAPDGGWMFPLAFTASRMGGAIAFFVLAAKLGAVPLILAFTGFLAARAVAIRLIRRRS
jgi:hypothetical protein